MTRLLCTADWHIPPVRSAGGPLSPSTGLPVRFHDYINTVRRLAEYAVDHDVHAVLFAGDLWAPVGNTADADQVTYLRQALNPLRHNGIRVFALPGNHDGARDMNSVGALGHATDSMVLLPNSGCVQYEVGYTNASAVNIAYVQYHSPEMIRRTLPDDQRSDWEALRDALKALVWGAVAQGDPVLPTVLMLHQSLFEAEVKAGGNGRAAQTMLGREFGLSVNDLPPVAAVVCGHIHLAQTLREANPLVFYPGSIERVDFGEAEQEKSWSILEIDDDGATRLQRVDSGARRFCTLRGTLDGVRAHLHPGPANLLGLMEQVQDEPGTWDCQPGDMVRAIVRARSDERWGDEREALRQSLLAQGALEATVVEETLRVENPFTSQVRAAMTPWDNLQAAARESSLELTDTHRELFEAAQTGLQATGGVSALGEALRPVRLEADGFTSLDQIDLPLGDLSVAVASGRNGAGKSSLCVEAPLWCLTGENLRGARRTEHGAVCRQDCRVAMEFVSPANRYRVERTYHASDSGKTASSGLTLWQWDEALSDWQNISAATSTDTQAKVNAIFGLEGDGVEVLLRTVFLAQGQSGAFATASPAERKDVLAAMLGLGYWEKLHETLKAAQKGHDNYLADLAGQQRTLEGFGGQEPLQQAEDELAHAGPVAESWEFIRKEREAKLKAADEGCRRQELAFSDARRLAEQRGGVEQRLAQSQEALQEIEQRLADCRATSGRAPEVASMRTRHAAIVQDLGEYDALKQERDAAARDALQAEHARQMAEKDRDKQLSDWKAQAATRSAEAARAALTAKVLHLRADDELRMARQLADQELQDAVSLGRLHRVVPCASLEVSLDVPCPLLDQSREADRSIPGLEERLAELQSVPALVSDLAAQSLAAAWEDHLTQVALQAEERALLDAPWGVEESAAWDAAVKRLEETNDALDAWKEDHGPDLLARSRDELEQEISGLSQLVTIADSHIPLHETRERELKTSCEALQQELCGMGEAPALGPLADALENARHASEAAQRELGTARAEEADARAALNRAREHQDAAQKAAEQLAALELPLARARAQERAYADLVLLSGRSGVVARLLDEALPRVEASASGILELLSGGTMTVQLHTRTTGKAGSIKETLDVVISTPSRTGAYETFSGGERVRIDLALTVGLSALLASSTGTQLRWIVLDELCAPLDAEGRTVFVEAVSRLAEAYPLVIVISHLEDVKALFEQRIELEKVGDGTVLRRAA